MALADLVRGAYRIADNATKGLQPAVVHRRWLSADTFGNANYSNQTIEAIVEYVSRLVLDRDKNEVVSSARIDILQPLTPIGSGREGPIDARDLFVMPDGRTMRVISTEGMVDKGTDYPFAHRVYVL
jgi:hypothetical protein